MIQIRTYELINFIFKAMMAAKDKMKNVYFFKTYLCNIEKKYITYWIMRIFHFLSDNFPLIHSLPIIISISCPPFLFLSLSPFFSVEASVSSG